MASLEQAQLALSAGASAEEPLAHAYSSAIDLYGRLNPTKTTLCAHLQGLLESCIMRIDQASREADARALDAALHLLQPLQSVFPQFID